MPRKLRVEYAGALYHVMSRGDRREDIFLDDVDRQDFIKTLAEGCQKAEWEVQASPHLFHFLAFKGVGSRLVWPARHPSRLRVGTDMGLRWTAQA